MAVTAILTHMRQLLSLHRTLLETGEGKKEALIHNQVNELAGWVNKESRLIKQITETQHEWRTSVFLLLTSLGKKPSSLLTITDISQWITPEESRKELLDLHRQLLDLIQELKQQNTRNQQLIERSLDYINYSIDLVSGGNSQEVVYGNPTASSKAGNGAHRYYNFDTRA